MSIVNNAEAMLKLIGFVQTSRNDYEYDANGYPIRAHIDYTKKESHIDYGEKIKVEHGAITNLEKTENLVHLECVIRLLKKGYRPEQIQLEKRYPLGHNKGKGRLDILLKKNDIPWGMIECKAYDKYDEALKKTQKSGDQIFSYYAQDRTPEIIGLYSADFGEKRIESYFAQITTSKLEKIGSVEDIHKSWDKEFIETGIFANEKKPYENQDYNLKKCDLHDLNEKSGDKLYNTFMEILRKNAISDKSNAFNVLFNLLVCKIYDEESCKNTGTLKFQWEVDDNIDKFMEKLGELYYKSISEYLSLKYEEKYHTKFVGGKQFPIREFSFIEILKEKDYIDNAKIIIEIVKTIQLYKFKYNTRQQFLGDFFEYLLAKGFKQEAGQFFTPIPISRFMLRALPIEQIIKRKISSNKTNILPYTIDYACGAGHFLTEALCEIEKHFYIIQEEELSQLQLDKLDTKDYKWAKEYIYGIEKDTRLAKISKIAMFLNGDGEARIISSDGLADFYETKAFQDKLSVSKKSLSVSSFDLVVSNPPFAVPGFSNTIDNLNNFKCSDFLTEKSKEIECFFVERTLQLLNDGGCAALILPLSVLNNTNALYTFTRFLLLVNFDIVCITEMREKTFLATNTSVAIFFLRKKSKAEMKQMLTRFRNYCGISEKSLEEEMVFIEENGYVAKDISGKLGEFVLTEELNDKKILIAFSGEKKTQEYFQGYRYSTARGNEKFTEANYGILTCTEGLYGEEDLASVINQFYEGNELDFSDKKLAKFAKFIQSREVLGTAKSKYIITAPSALLSYKTIQIKSISPIGDILEQYKCMVTSLSELEDKADIEFLNGLNYNKSDEVPFRTSHQVATASNIDLKTGMLDFDKKIIYLREDFKDVKSLKIVKNDVIISMNSGSLHHLGKVAIAKEDCDVMAGGFLRIIRCKNASLAYAIYYNLMSKSFREFVFRNKGQNINNLNEFEMKRQPILIPEDINPFYSKVNELDE